MSFSEDQLKGIKTQKRLIRSCARDAMRDGVGAMDALYELAVKHGADPKVASGFAHTANGAFALMEGDVASALSLVDVVLSQ